MVRPNACLMVVLYLTIGCDKSAAPVSKPPADFTNTPADFTMTAKDLYLAEGPNGNKYNEKVVEVSGEVSQAYGGHLRGMRGKPFFKLLAVTSSVNFITCTTDDPQPWAKIVPGQQIKVKGRQKTLLENCVIVDYGKDPSITISPEELAKEHQADLKGTAKKYDEKYLRLEGDVVSFKLGNKGEISRTPDIIVLKGNGAVQIECHFIGDFRDTEPENAQGQARLKVVGMFKKDDDKKKVILENCHVILP